MLLNNDKQILEKTNADLYRPIEKPLHEIDSYISDLPNMTAHQWLDEVPYCVFEDFVIRMVELLQDLHQGEYLPAIKFSDYILNFAIAGLNPWPYGTNPEISIDFVLCNKGLRDRAHRNLIIEQHKYYNTHRKNSWSTFLDKYTITKFMYDFMKEVKDDIIFQEYPWKF